MLCVGHLSHNPKKEKVAKLAKDLQVDTTIAKILCLRNIYTFKAAKKYFRPSLEDIHDPFLMKDMEIAVARIESAIYQQRKYFSFWRL